MISDNELKEQKASYKADIKLLNASLILFISHTQNKAFFNIFFFSDLERVAIKTILHTFQVDLSH